MKFKALFALALSASLLTACFGGSVGDSYYAFKSTTNGKWGMVSPAGKVLFDEEFKDQPTDIVGGMFLARTGKDNMWQIYEASSRPSTASDESFKDIFPFTEDVTLAVKEEGNIMIIDKQGKEVVTLEKAGADFVGYARPFSEGIAIVGTSAGYGAINTKGEVVVKPKYCWLSSFSDGVALGMENKYKEEQDPENINLSVIDAKGETLFTIKRSKYFDIKGEFHNGLLPVCKKDGNEQKWGFLNKKGDEVIKPTAKNAAIGDWNDAVYVFSDGKQWGLKSASNDDVLIRCKYDALNFADKDGSLLWAGERNHREYKWSLVNRKGDVISKEAYKGYKIFNGDFAPVKVSNTEWVVINKNGEEQKMKADINTLGGFSDMPEAIFSQRLSAALGRKGRSNNWAILNALEGFAYDQTEGVGDMPDEEEVDPYELELENLVYADAYDGFVNIRSSASDRGVVIGKFKNGREGAKILGKERGWLLIDYKGVRGYVYSKYVSSRPTDPVFVAVDGHWMKGTWTDGSTKYILDSYGGLTVIHPDGQKGKGNWQLAAYDVILQATFKGGETETKRLPVDMDNNRLGNLRRR